MKDKVARTSGFEVRGFSPVITDSLFFLPVPYSVLPIPCSLFPISLFPVP